jgi:hypothetical protein
MTPEERAKDLLPKLLLTSDAPIRAAHEILLATALREAEQSAFERAAKCADSLLIGDEVVPEHERLTSHVANAIRDLGKSNGERP